MKIAQTLGILLLLIVPPVFAETTAASLFSTPDGFSLREAARPSKFGVFDNNGSRYFCKKSPCTSKADAAFNAEGNISAEGTITVLEYKIDGSKKLSSLQVIKSYENAVKELGGKRINDLVEGGANLFVIEKPNTKYWVDVYTSYNDGFKLTIIESGGFVQLVTAAQLSDQINKQGFANLNVNFDTNKSLIKDIDKAAINEVVTLLKNDSKLKLSVEGHTDNVGSASVNKTLSQARSDSLVGYMVAAGIATNRLAAKGFGSESPIADNRSEEGRAKNRRVELVKIK